MMNAIMENPKKFFFFSSRRRHTRSASSISLEHPQKQPVTEPGKSYPCTDPSPPFPEGSLPHRYICQVNRDSLPGEACQAREFRTDNLPLRPSLARLLLEEVKLLRFPRAVCL